MKIYSMDQLKLFPTDDFISERLRNTMNGNTCKTCANRFVVYSNPEKRFHYCKVFKDHRTSNGNLRVRIGQPACIHYEPKNQ